MEQLIAAQLPESEYFPVGWEYFWFTGWIFTTAFLIGRVAKGDLPIKIGLIIFSFFAWPLVLGFELARSLTSEGRSIFEFLSGQMPEELKSTKKE